MKELFNIPFKCFTFIIVFDHCIDCYIVNVWIDNVKFAPFFPQISIEDCFSELKKQYDYKPNSARFITEN